MKKLFEFNFEFDDFQLEAINHIKNDKSVVVCAPTGAGKTVIAEYAINLAIEKNERVFYTTPLKALSNQKFRDFQAAIGEENVGLLTGDTSINRDAPVVVMTTEVFRNMLYGTAFGPIDENLKKVNSVVLDECHYMNDEGRGTVWEESIIYCPQEIKIIALSATIANAQELTDWINTVHSDTRLVNSDFRPVPLRHFHFANDRLIPLISPGGFVNKKLKQIRLHKGNYQKKKKRIPSQVVQELSDQNMLPAIYFCFSRKRCDLYLEQCSRLNLLSEFEHKKLQQIIDKYIQENPLLRTHKHLELIYSGVASHHAGLLPGWKVLIEKLFQQGLIKVVFATETLAAGINMPARTTIISEISKRSDDGHRNLTASEFLQMSGRAGRRGMDKVGYVVTIANPYKNPDEVADLATSDAEPLKSQFTPTYSMVLNLLQRFSLEEARQLILSSFGYYSSTTRLKPLYDEQDKAKRDINRIINFECPYGLVNEDLVKYQKNKEKYVQAKRLFNTLLKQAKKANRKNAPEVTEYKEKSNEYHDIIKASPCYFCPNYKQHIRGQEVLTRFNRRLSHLDKTITVEKDLYWHKFLNIVKVLEDFNYIKESTILEPGITSSFFRCDNELYLTEVLNSGILDRLSPPELAGIFCALISEEPRNGSEIMVYPNRNMIIAEKEIYGVVKKVKTVQKKHNVNRPLLLSSHLSGVTEIWASGSEWETVTSQTDMDEGDIVRTIKRTVDIIRQVIQAPYINPELKNKCKIAFDALNREPIIEIF